MEIQAPHLEHVKRLTGAHGIVQFAHGSIPDLESGFCLDDNVRLLMLAVALRRENPDHPYAIEAGNVVFDFIAEAAADAPVYHNMMDRYGNFTDRFASPEAIGRLIWAMGVVLRESNDKGWQSRARFHLERAMCATVSLSSAHARAFAALGWAAAVQGGYQRYRTALCAVAEAMHFEYERNVREGWSWTENAITYDAARLPEAMMRAGAVLDEPEIAENGRRAFEFLAGITQSNGMFEPIGAPGWYHRGGERPFYSQQPLEAFAMIDAWLAYGDPLQARVAFEWFLGRNSDGLVLADLDSGGCRDGIHETNVLNENMGAESTLAFLQSAYALRLHDRNINRFTPAIVGELGRTRSDRDDEVTLRA